MFHVNQIRTIFHMKQCPAVVIPRAGGVPDMRRSCAWWRARPEGSAFSLPCESFLVRILTGQQKTIANQMIICYSRACSLAIYPLLCLRSALPYLAFA